jgi:predicted nucleic acid-binding protein
VSRVFWDTNLFIYLIQDFGELSERVVRIRERMLDCGDQLYTSSLTLGEVLVKPVQAGAGDLIAQFEQAIDLASVVVPFDRSASRTFARIRAADLRIRPPDAIQLACAAQVSIDLFITNDERLSDKSVVGIQFITSLYRAPI